MPTYPPGFSTAIVTVGEVVDFFGSEPATLTVEVTPFLGERATHIVHNETGVAMAATTRVFDSDTGTVSFSLPHTDMPGWVDESGRTVSRWKYVIRVTAKPLDPRVSPISWKKEISPVIGQNLIDLELVPSTVTAEQFTLPPAPVTTVNGQTGAVTIPPAPVSSVNGLTGAVVLPNYEIRGIGMPNGAVTAPPGTYYTDTAGTNGALRWLKKSGNGNTGWVIAIGDTGWREIGSLLTASITGKLAIRRVNNIVQVNYNDIRNPGATNHINVFAWPSGFEPVSLNSAGMNMRESIVADITGANVRILSTHLGYSRILTMDQNVLYGGYSTVTTHAHIWPTVLPGNPVI